MQLTQLMVIMGFTHFSCGVQSESSSEFDKNMMCLAPHLRTTLRKQMEETCSAIPELKKTLGNVERCRFTCEMKDTSGHNLVAVQHFRLKDGTPCGYDMLQFMMALDSRKPSTLSTKLADVPALLSKVVCQAGECIDILDMKFV
uniref:Putative tick ixostatin n=1 Tax=Ixodes ricinus TaxID=34613 RepID=A0A6B0UTW9_IXORI